MINKAKSVVLFTRNTKALDRGAVRDTLSVTRETNKNEKYFGLPVHIGQSKIKSLCIFGPCLEENTRMEGKILVMGQERNSNQGSGSSDPHFRYRLLRSYEGVV
jgi:hypothetical protein